MHLKSLYLYSFVVMQLQSMKLMDEKKKLHCDFFTMIFFYFSICQNKTSHNQIYSGNKAVWLEAPQTYTMNAYLLTISKITRLFLTCSKHFFVLFVIVTLFFFTLILPVLVSCAKIQLEIHWSCDICARTTHAEQTKQRYKKKKKQHTQQMAKCK